MDAHPVPRHYAITNTRVFDGEEVIDADTVICDNGVISEVGHAAPPPGATVIDGAGAPPLPGLIDAHVHPDDQGLRPAALFGVTTVVEMGGAPRSQEERAASGWQLPSGSSSSSMLTNSSFGCPHTAVSGGRQERMSARSSLSTVKRR